MRVSRVKKWATFGRPNGKAPTEQNSTADKAVSIVEVIDEEKMRSLIK